MIGRNVIGWNVIGRGCRMASARFALQLSDRLYASWQVARRALISTLYSPGIYVISTLTLLAASTLVLNNLAFLSENGLLVLTRPFFLPAFVCGVILSLYLSLHATLQLVREREQGTLKVLLFGPVDGVSFLLGKLWSHSILYGLAAVMVVLWAVVLGQMTNLLVQVDLIGVMGLGLLANGGIVALGLFVGAWGRTARTSLIVLALVLLLALIAQFGDQALVQMINQGVGQANRQDPVRFLRAALDGLHGLILWLSPLAQMSRGMDALLVADGAALLWRAGAIIGQTALYFFGAAWALKRGGP